jgi:hypothetical protein
MSHDRPQPLRDAWEQCIRADPRMTGTTLLVLAIAATYANRDGTALRVGVSRLCEDTGLAERSVRYAITAGIKAGYLHRERRGRRHGDVGIVSEYRLTLPLPVTRDRLTPVDGAVDAARPTGTGMPVGMSPTGTIHSPNRHLTTSQPAPGCTPPVVDQERPTRAQARARTREASCGRCMPNEPGCWLADHNGHRSAQHGPCHVGRSEIA